MSVKPIPEGYHTVTPSMNVQNASEAIEFLKKAFGAEERFRMPMPDGKLMYAEVQIGNSPVGISDAVHDGPMPISAMIYVEKVDEVYARAIKAGAKEKMPIQNLFWGDRGGSVMDPYGNHWFIATHVEDVSPEEMQKRSEAMFKGG